MSFHWTTSPSMTVVPQLESLSSLRLDKISKIDVSRNRLQTIESALAGWLGGEHRRVLDISHNQVAALPGWLLAASLNTELAIRGNPFHCTCDNFRQYSNFFEVTTVLSFVHSHLFPLLCQKY